ncbi:MAG: UvrD-helicase domain-containing protein, partial [Solirubrobacterales bacterium]|nr:UvrD-helicase domain-containing protein [Solirubrobacterales bacterium]
MAVASLESVVWSDQSTTRWTAQQLRAIECRNGDLLLDAAAGSGKTSVLVERFVRSVFEDGVDVASILAITFTDKAAAELRDRIRGRLRELGAREAARATEGASISTIHGFCSRLLRAHALAAGLDPAFSVLDQLEAQRLADAAFNEALEDLTRDAPDGIELVASYGPGSLRGAIVGTYAELRSRGELAPALAALRGPPVDLEGARDELFAAALAAASELGSVAEPSTRVAQALERLDACESLIATELPWPGDLERVALPGGNGAALSTPVCVAYGEALERFRAGCEQLRAERVHPLLDRLLRGFGARYEERKRSRSGLDFEDLELIARSLLARDGELRERYRDRFAQIMVDELQDTNQVQLELIELIANGNLFTVGDAQQSIYGFRHADVELFERRGERLATRGARATLQTNFRGRREILDVLNRAFEPELGERFIALRAGRDQPAAGEPLVELLIADKGADWACEGLVAPWRLAEARALAARIGELIERGSSPREIVVLIRATTDLRCYERALEERGIPTYVIGGRGYWAHPQVLDLVAYLRALANPRDEEALYTVLSSPLVGVSADALVVLAAAGRAAGRDPWWVLRDPEGRLDDLGVDDRDMLAWFAEWFAHERGLAGHTGIDQLIGRALSQTGYDLAMLAMPGGERRLANVRKLMRLAREHEAGGGAGLRGFLELARSHAFGVDARESEAPVEGEALDAVRLMTIHRAKGLEFEIVCVADLGRAPRRGGELLRIGRDGRLGLRLAQPGTGKREPALDYRELGEERQRAEEREERRLFYVAMTRARERLIVSGAARLDSFGVPTNGGAPPISWIAPALVADIAARVVDGSGTTEEGVRWRIVSTDEAPTPLASPGAPASPSPGRSPAAPAAPPAPPPAPPDPPPVTALSYSSLGEYQRCGYRFYVERVLGIPPVAQAGAGSSTSACTTSAGLGASERGILVHALLEQLDFRLPARPSPEAIAAAARRAGLADDGPFDDIVELIDAFARSELCARLARATAVRREERFSFMIDAGVAITGALDAIAREPRGRILVVDYKSDRLDGADPRAVVARQYAVQRLIYAVAALRAGADEVEV